MAKPVAGSNPRGELDQLLQELAIKPLRLVDDDNARTPAAAMFDQQRAQGPQMALGVLELGRQPEPLGTNLQETGEGHSVIADQRETGGGRLWLGKQTRQQR